MKETINKDTYQTLKEIKVQPPPFEKSITPLWKPDTGQTNNVSIMVGTPVHSECSIHYTSPIRITTTMYEE